MDNLGIHKILKINPDHRRGIPSILSSQEEKIPYNIDKIREKNRSLWFKYEALFIQNKFQEILNKSEKDLLEGKNLLVPKFWWFRVQFNRRKIPVSLLASSFIDYSNLFQSSINQLDSEFLPVVKSDYEKLRNNIIDALPDSIEKEVLSNFNFVSNKASNDKIVVERKILKEKPRNKLKYILIVLFLIVVVLSYQVNSFFNESSLRSLIPEDSLIYQSEYDLPFEKDFIISKSDYIIPEKENSKLKNFLSDLEKNKEKNKIQKAIQTQKSSKKIISQSKFKLDMTKPVETKKIKDLVESYLSGKNIDTDPKDVLLDKKTKDLMDSYWGSDKPEVAGAGNSFKIKQNIYRVVRQTYVYENIDKNSNIMDSLEIGQGVEVERIIGRWLKVRSTDGKIGYVLKRDTQKLNN